MQFQLLPFQKLIEHSVCIHNDSTKEFQLLDFDEIQTNAQWKAVLVTKCNERIKEIEKKQTTWWIMSAGRANKRVETWNEFRDSNTVGFFWNDVGDLSKLSEDEIKEGFKKYEKDWGPGRDILKIKKDTETKTIESHLTRIRKKLLSIIRAQTFDK